MNILKISFKSSSLQNQFLITLLHDMSHDIRFHLAAWKRVPSHD